MSNGGGQENIIERNQDKAVRRLAAFIGKSVDWIGKNVLPLSEPKQVNAFHNRQFDEAMRPHSRLFGACCCAAMLLNRRFALHPPRPDYGAKSYQKG